MDYPFVCGETKCRDILRVKDDYTWEVLICQKCWGKKDPDIKLDEARLGTNFRSPDHCPVCLKTITDPDHELFYSGNTPRKLGECCYMCLMKTIEEMDVGQDFERVHDYRNRAGERSYDFAFKK